MRKFNLLKNLDEIMKDFYGESMNYEHPLLKYMGNTKTETGSDEDGEWKKTSYESPDGSYSVVSFVKYGHYNDEPKNEKSNLQKLLDKAVEEQNFEEAVKLRDKIKSLEKNKEKIDSLKSKLETAVKNQDYEKAIEIRDEIKKLEK